jgi:hypothetical protein
MDWKTSQYIVEEDSEEIELIEYEFGKNGQPFYVSGPFVNNAKVISTLNRSVGEGNYLSVFSMGGFDDDDEDYDYDDDEEEFWMSEEIQSLAIMRYYVHKKDRIKAEMYLDLIEEIAPEESHTINATKIFDTSQKKKSIFKLW